MVEKVTLSKKGVIRRTCFDYSAFEAVTIGRLAIITVSADGEGIELTDYLSLGRELFVFPVIYNFLYLPDHFPDFPVGIIER